MPGETDHRKFYYVFGLTTTIQGSQLVAACPFCGKEDHFYINRNTGQFECKAGACMRKGNNWSFLQQLHEQLTQEPQDYSWLCENRFLKESTFQHVGVVQSPTGEWLIPVRNQKGSVVNLYRAFLLTDKDGKDRLNVISSPAPCTQHLYGQETIKPSHKTVYVVEGHWDRMALIEIMAHLAPIEDGYKLKGKPDFENELLTNNAIVAVPGAGIFKEVWLPLLKGKEVILIFDNDKAGRTGCDRLTRMVQESSHVPKSLAKVIWSEDDPNDIRDLLAIERLSHLKAFQRIQERTTSISLSPEKVRLNVESDTNLEYRDCTNFKELIEMMSYEPTTKMGLHMTDDIKHTFAAMLAVILSTPIKGGQLGLRVRGPASSAKSTLAEICSQNDEEFVYPRDTFTGIISGSLSASNMMAKRMDGKCLIIKEADTLLNLPNLSQIESELRSGLGDGVIRAEWRNSKQAIEVHCLFTCIMCGTNRIQDIDDARLGSRFFDIVIHREDTDTSKILETSFETSFSNIAKQLSGEADEYDTTSRKSITMRIAPYVNGFLRHKTQQIKEGIRIAPFTESQAKRAKALANLLAFGRAKVDRDRQKNLKRRGEREVPARINESLMRFFMLLAIVLYDSKTPKITNEIFEIVKNLVRDSSDNWQFQIIEILYNQKNRPATSEYLKDKLGLSKTQVVNITNDMKELGILEKASEKISNGSGRKAHYHSLTETVFNLCKEGLR